MLKVRLMGTRNNIKWFIKLLKKDKRIKILQISDLYANKGTNKYYRAYAEVEKETKKKEAKKLH